MNWWPIPQFLSACCILERGAIYLWYKLQNYFSTFSLVFWLYLLPFYFNFICAQSLCPVWHFAIPWTITLLQVPLSMKFFQARMLEWVAISSSRRSSRPRDRTNVSCISCLGRQVLYHCTTWGALILFICVFILVALGLCCGMWAFSSCGTLVVLLQHAGLVTSWCVGS